MRKIVVVSALLVLAMLGAVLVHAAPKLESYRMDRQFVGSVGPATVQSTEFRPVSNWGFSDGAAIRARGAIAVTLSAVVEGGPAEFRILMELPERDWAVRPMRPSRVRFDPGSAAQPFSFTFVTWVPDGPYTINLFWRSPSGAEVTLTSGTVAIQYGNAARSAGR
ncbi:MAG TPA: hypothetical protein VLA82_04900 [Actinomycetota bacterium]|nr:hypothetical protein [Actinomycetota bacterium]